MDIEYKVELEDGEMSVYMNASEEEVKFLHRIALQYMISNDQFPFRLLTKQQQVDYHQMPEVIQ